MILRKFTQSLTSIFEKAKPAVVDGSSVSTQPTEGTTPKPSAPSLPVGTDEQMQLYQDSLQFGTDNSLSSLEQGLYTLIPTLVGEEKATQAVKLGASKGLSSEQRGLYSLAATFLPAEDAELVIAKAKDAGLGGWDSGLYAVAGAIAGPAGVDWAIRQGVESKGTSGLEKGLYSVASAIAGPERAAEVIKSGEDVGHSGLARGMAAVTAAVSGLPTASWAISEAYQSGYSDQERSFNALAAAINPQQAEKNLATGDKLGRGGDGFFALASTVAGSNLVESLHPVAEQNSTSEEGSALQVLAGLSVLNPEKTEQFAGRFGLSAKS